MCQFEMLTIKITKKCENISASNMKIKEWMVTDSVESLNNWLDTMRKNQKIEYVTYGSNFVIKYEISYVTKKSITELVDNDLLFNALIIYPDTYILYEYFFHKPIFYDIKEIFEDMKKMKFDKFIT